MKPSAEIMDTAVWRTLFAKVVPGHQVASGNNQNPLFPGGTIRMQVPHFRELGLDLSQFHPGTINISIAPNHYQVLEPAVTLRAVQWHPSEPAEDFSFFDVEVSVGDGLPVRGYIYYPHPDTKPTHFQNPDVLELLLPFVKGVEYGATLKLKVPVNQLAVHEPANPGTRELADC